MLKLYVIQQMHIVFCVSTYALNVNFFQKIFFYYLKKKLSLNILNLPSCKVSKFPTSLISVIQLMGETLRK